MKILDEVEGVKNGKVQLSHEDGCEFSVEFEHIKLVCKAPHSGAFFDDYHCSTERQSLFVPRNTTNRTSRKRH